MSTRDLLPYQTAWVTNNAPVAAIEKSRRIGISWAEAYHAVMHTSEIARAGRKTSALPPG